MIWVRVGALLMAAGVLLGAFGAHGLKDALDAAHMEIYRTAVFYHLLNALGLVLVGTLHLQSPTRTKLFPCGVFLSAGILMFSGSLYLLSTGGGAWLGLLTPVGGICLAAGWIFLIFGL